MIFHKPFQELKIILYLSIVLLLSIYIHQGYEVYALDESIVYTFLIPILITHHILHTYSFSKNHIKFYGLRTKEVYIQTWYHVLCKSFIDIVIWYLFTYVLFQQYMKLSHISVDIIYDFIYIYALSLIALSVTNKTILSYMYVIIFSFRNYIPFHLFKMFVPTQLHTFKEIIIICTTACLLWTLKILYLRYSTH
jgi:hypothetical protein